MAMRMPISRVRRATENAINPYSPISASAKPTAPIVATISTMMRSTDMARTW